MTDQISEGTLESYDDITDAEYEEQFLDYSWSDRPWRDYVQDRVYGLRNRLAALLHRVEHAIAQSRHGSPEVTDDSFERYMEGNPRRGRPVLRGDAVRETTRAEYAEYANLVAMGAFSAVEETFADVLSSTWHSGINNTEQCVLI